MKFFYCQYYFFSSSSISWIVGNVPLKFSGISLFNSYSEIPIGWLKFSIVYFAKISSLSLHIKRPIVGLSVAFFRIWFMSPRYIKNQLLNRQNVQLFPKLGDNCIQLRIKQIKFFDIIEICSRKTMRIGHQTYNITNQKLFKGYYILLKSHLFFTQKLITFYSKVRFKK